MYYNYRTYCKEHEFTLVGHNNFTKNLISAAAKEGIKCTKENKRDGVYIKGIRINPEIYYTDRLSETEDKSVEGEGCGGLKEYPIAYCPPARNVPHRSLDPKLVEKYVALFHKTPLKESLNKAAKRANQSILGQLVENFMREKKLNDPLFRESVTNIMSRSLANMEKNGMISYKLQSLGDSPRFQPAYTAGSVNTFKRNVKVYGFKLMASEAENQGYVLMDLDLKSCYASVAVGLYPHITPLLRNSMDTVGLWEFIKNEFKREGKEQLYSKGSVKVCVYASFFGGGRPAFKNAILDLWRGQLGLQEKKFKESDSYPEMASKASAIGNEVMNSAVTKSFRQCAQYFYEVNKGMRIVGPCGFSMNVDEPSNAPGSRTIRLPHIVHFCKALKEPLNVSFLLT